MATRLDPACPFMLLDDARTNGADARLFAAPERVIEAHAHTDIEPALAKIDAAIAHGRHVAGFVTYEAGFAFEDRLAPLRRDPEAGDPPLLWFGVFDEVERIAPSDIPPLLPDSAGSFAAAPEPRISYADYARRIGKLHDHIAAGDIYQANFTFPCDVTIEGDPLALYARLRRSSRAGYGGIVWTGAHWLLSLSPELFFSLADGAITARPMKGTAERLADPVADRETRETLRTDPKQRAENLMITDLLRNDLSRIARDGSVAVPSLFHVESFPTIHQMTSTVTADLAPGKSAIDVARAIYPCGSITGAPKIRAMEIIADLESAARGPYTGSIGWFGPEGDAAMNVAIRTLVLAKGSSRAVLGLGSGIVVDSRAPEEWRECLAKGAFVNEGQQGFDLVETMRFDPEAGIAMLDRHLARMKASARALGFAFDRHAARNDLQSATFRLREPARIRMLLSRRGAIAVEVGPLPETPAEPVAVDIALRAADSADFRLRHKTSDRRIYADARNGRTSFETLLEDQDGLLTEGCFTNLFVERDGVMLTPPLSRGLLPGTLRADLIEAGKAREADLRREDLIGGLFIGNAVRGLVGARLV